MSIKHPRIYLASQSPRRRELLKQIGVHFDVLLLRNAPLRALDVDETPHQNELPEIYVQRLCREKAQAGYKALKARKLPLQPVLAADTTVTLNGKIFGKPQNATEGAAMLRELAGRDHQVLTAVAIAQSEHTEVLLSVSTVRFTQLSDKRIAHYLKSGEYSDKAGGYGIQGHAAAFIEHLSGSYSGVMGLPIFETVQLLQHFDFPTP